MIKHEDAIRKIGRAVADAVQPLLEQIEELKIVTAQCRLAQQHSYDSQCIAERNEEKANALLDEMRSAWAAGIQYDNWRANYNKREQT